MLTNKKTERIPPGTPHGLEFLLPTNIIAIQQQIELGEGMLIT